MHDDDDGTLEGDTEGGRLYHSGIRPESEIEPADYALPPGVPALQGEACDDVPLADSLVSRRGALALLLGSGAIGAIGFWSGRVTAGTVTHRQLGTRLSLADLERIEAARAWADAPLERLVRARSPFLWTIRMVEPDTAIRRGLERLCNYALLEGGLEGYETARAILATFEAVPPPLEFLRHREALQAVVLRWQTRPTPANEDK